VKARYHLLFVTLLVIAAILLFFPSAFLFTTEIKKIVFRSPQIDKIGHFISFFILAWVMHSHLKISLMTTLGTLTFYGAFTEFGQFYLGFRNAEFSDFFADIFGIIFFILLKSLYLFYNRILFTKYNQTPPLAQTKKREKS
jgi:VanZ family protein